jgi:hypothetical protein
METLHLEAFVCAKDRTAGHLMHTLMAVGDLIAEVEALRVTRGWIFESRWAMMFKSAARFSTTAMGYGGAASRPQFH